MKHLFLYLTALITLLIALYLFGDQWTKWSAYPDGKYQEPSIVETKGGTP